MIRVEEIEKLTLTDCLSYRDILSTFTIISEVNLEFALNDDLFRFIADFLVIEPVYKEEIRIVDASSNRNDFALENVLMDDTTTWWISESGTMTLGRGEEYLEFSISNNNQLRRVQSIHISIPPMPFGPASVQTFRVDYWIDNGCGTTSCWMKGIDIMTVSSSRYGMQRFDLRSPIDAARVRLVCLSNQTSSLGTAGYGVLSPDCVGLYAVHWS